MAYKILDETQENELIEIIVATKKTLKYVGSNSIKSEKILSTIRFLVANNISVSFYVNTIGNQIKNVKYFKYQRGQNVNYFLIDNSILIFKILGLFFVLEKEIVMISALLNSIDKNSTQFEELTLVENNNPHENNIGELKVNPIERKLIFNNPFHEMFKFETWEKNLFYYGKKYYDLGFNMTIIKNERNEVNKNEGQLQKSPYNEWQTLKTKRQSLDSFLALNWENATGIGTVLGYNKLRAIDVDGCCDENVVEFILKNLNLPTSYQWITKSPSGFHILFYSEDIPQILIGSPNNVYIIERSKNYSQIEFKWAGHIVLPPSKFNDSSYLKIKGNEILVQPFEISKGIILELILKLSIKNSLWRLNEILNNFQLIRLGLEEFPTLIQSFYYYPFSDSKIRCATESPETWDVFENLRKVIVLDTETSFLPKNFNFEEWEYDQTPDIIQFSYLVFSTFGEYLDGFGDLIVCERMITYEDIEYVDYNGNLFYEKMPKVKPTIDLEVQNLTGINQDSYEKHSLSADFIYDFKKFIELIILKKIIVVGHNIEYDLNIILMHAYKNKNERLEAKKRIKTLCTMKESTAFCNLFQDNNSNKSKYPTLKDLHLKLFDKKMIFEHNAITDTIYTANCFWELVRRGIVSKKSFNYLDFGA